MRWQLFAALICSFISLFLMWMSGYMCAISQKYWEAGFIIGFLALDFVLFAIAFGQDDGGKRNCAKIENTK